MILEGKVFGLILKMSICINRLVINTTNFDETLILNGENELSFHPLVREPDEYPATNVKDFGVNVSKLWRTRNWGCVHDILSCNYVETEQNTVIHFNTDMTPPLPWVKTLSSKLKDVEVSIYYSAYKSDIYGWMSYTNGNVINGEKWYLNSSEEDVYHWKAFKNIYL